MTVRKVSLVVVAVGLDGVGDRPGQVVGRHGDPLAVDVVGPVRLRPRLGGGRVAGEALGVRLVLGFGGHDRPITPAGRVNARPTGWRRRWAPPRTGWAR